MYVTVCQLAFLAEIDYSKEVARSYLGNHRCLDLDNVTKRMFGGPTKADGDSECKAHLSMQE